MFFEQFLLLDYSRQLLFVGKMSSMFYFLQIQSDIVPPSVSSKVIETAFPALMCAVDQSDIDSMEDEMDEDYQPSKY